MAYWPLDDSVELLEETAASLLITRAKQNPDRVALIGRSHCGEERRLTYRQLGQAARAVADGLLAIAEPGENVAILAPNVVEWPAVEYGASLAGMVLVALNPSAGQEELRYTLGNSDAAVLIHANRNGARDLDAVVAEIRSDCPNVRTVVGLEEVRSWVEGSRPVERPLPLVDPASPAMIQYTSGTTGRQKGVLLAHRSMVNAARSLMISAGIGPDAVIMSPCPMFHTAGCITSTLGPLSLGATLVLMDRWDPDGALDLIDRESVDTVVFITTMLHGLINAAKAREGQYSLPTITVGGASVPSSMVEEAQKTFGATVLVVYGQTELSAPLTVTRRDDTVDDITRTIGRPVPQVECRIADIDTGKTVGVGVAGELCARGYQQMLEYYRNPEATAEAIDAEGWLHTGDLATMDERGVITLTGRLKELIIRGGENIAPAEIVDCLIRHENVDQAAVIGLPDERLGEIVAAVVVTKSAKPGLVQELRQYCAERIAPYKVPQRWYFADALPTTASGKIQGFVLRDRIMDNVMPEAGLSI